MHCNEMHQLKEEQENDSEDDLEWEDKKRDWRKLFRKMTNLENREDVRQEFIGMLSSPFA